MEPMAGSWCAPIPAQDRMRTRTIVTGSRQIGMRARWSSFSIADAFSARYRYA
jgi:hypothetical protein